MNFDWIQFILGIIFGSFLVCIVFVIRMVYVNSRERWRKSVEPPQVPVRFRQRTQANARPPEDQPTTPGVARVRPIRRHK